MWLERCSDEKDDKLIVDTVLAVGMRHESSFKLAMQALYHSVVSWAVRSCSDALENYEFAHLEEK